MASKREITKARLEDALQRLLNGCPIKVKQVGLLTLNKINQEAGLSNSYIHKFPDFVEYAKPIIDKYNKNRSKTINDSFSIEESKLTDEERLKAELNREKKLKQRYLLERNDAIKAQKELEKLNNTLMFRVFELQEILRAKNGGNIIDISE
ncbi:hypothetical protein D8T65_07520 [Vibrio vulnificus]|uniref:hypothetical protein n=1 Tax=Vibrio vulnificus TaxID=672 RepID=UPI0010232E43|nr:hypothetical protein [Vibrio vulnificus]RZP69396.1 hypothetical protein D8T45_01595 [Vibrio vulnificus]RZQ03683.1 hypothetical protein D8T65_07520 [Vibrio vulnificus]RZR20532.1 hypothetical protein D8T24_00015 [Vibrio vulnificus]HDY7972696.1 hypothetical protein [Vibrio vulnificus]